MSGLGALKKFGEALMRKADAGDPRLRRALDMGFDLENPLVHGTNKPLLDEKLGPLFLTREPDMALNYTSGGRRGGPGTPSKSPNYHVLLTNRKPAQAEDISAFEPMSWENLDVWRQFGIDNPAKFRRRANRINHENALELARKFKQEPWPVDDFFGSTTINPAFFAEERLRPHTPLLYELLDSRGVQRALREFRAPPLEFNHGYALNKITPRGLVRRTKNEFGDGEEMATAIFVHDPSVLRSPWAAFEEEGVGLLKKEGGLVQMRNCK